MPTDIQGWLQAGVGGIFLGALVLGYRRLWVFGWYAKELAEDRDFWRMTALKSMGHADKAIDIAVGSKGDG